MTKYVIMWTETHSTQVDAVDENAALSDAAEFAGRNNTRDKVSGYTCTRVSVDTPELPKHKPTDFAESRERNKGLTPAEMCHRMSTVELGQNIRRGGVAAIREGELRANEMNRADPTPWWGHYTTKTIE
jgi:hypothetical protein